MGRVKTLPCRVANIGERISTATPDRQATRQYATHSSAWPRIRDWVLVRDHYTCQRCQKLVGGKGEAHVDHIDGDSSNNPEDGSNWQTLCAPCHSAKTATEDGGFGAPRRA